MRWLALTLLTAAACGPPTPTDRESGQEAICVDPDGDGDCDFELDPVCMAGADHDPLREDACLMMALAGADRRLFAEEAGGAVPLAWDERLYNVALGHAEDMCERDYFEHVNPEGQSPTDRARAMGYDFSVAENIVVSSSTLHSHYLWMDEPTCEGHRGNVLNPKNQHVGVAVVRCAEGRWQGYLMGVQNFHMTHSAPEPAFCRSEVTACEMPAEPRSAAFEFCDRCEPTSEPEMMQEWGCPAD